MDDVCEIDVSFVIHQEKPLDTKKLHSQLYVFAHEHRVSYYQIDMERHGRGCYYTARFHAKVGWYIRAGVEEDLRKIAELNDMAFTEIYQGPFYG